MAFKILTGPDSPALSERVCADAAKAAAQAPFDNYIIVTPAQSVLRMQKTLVEVCRKHTAMNAEVTTFNRLARKLFDEQGIVPERSLDDTGRTIILRRILEENREELALYGNLVEQDGFIDEMLSVISELDTCGITGEKLKRIKNLSAADHPELSLKLADIQLVYEKFHQEINGRYSLQEEVLWRASKLRVILRICGTHMYILTDLLLFHRHSFRS